MNAPALLLLGPTGSGKTPLGDWLERQGLGGRGCHHFDFGAQLRTVAGSAPAAGFSAAEVGLVRAVLARGALLEDKNFPVAEKLLRGFLAARRGQPADWVVLNGLPRHVGQAIALASLLTVHCIVELRCDGATVRERLARNAGGDRGERVDDQAVLVGKKLALYTERTRPLVEHYRERGSAVIPVAVGGRTTAADMARQIGDALAARTDGGRALAGQ